jgi:hypothetical protein
MAVESAPIFVHASPRSGSTYFFNVLRRDKALMCFNEAIIDGKHDLAGFMGINGRNKGGSSGAEKWNVNHQFLEREDFDEFIQAWDAVMHLCPKFPAFVEYLPPKGVLSTELSVYLSALLDYARSKEKRPVFCEINSRGRAGALRAAFSGFHITQYRDPISQFGSFIRAVVDAGFWGFLAFPVTELGTSGTHPLYGLIPEKWRAPHLPWRATTRAQHWASDAQYFATVGSPQPENLEKVFRWHMFSWLLTNLAAMSYSDVALDIDKVHDDLRYRATVVDTLSTPIGVAVNFDDVKKFDRYYEFESFDVSAVSNEVISSIQTASSDGRLASAILTLGARTRINQISASLDALIVKIRNSLAAMKTNPTRVFLSEREWTTIVGKNRKIWFNEGVRRFTEHVYPLAAPIVHAARRAGMI